MENMTKVQAIIFAKAISDAWDELPDAEELEFGPATEKKARAAINLALEAAEVKDVGIKPNADELEDLAGQFLVYLESADNIADLSRMEDELAELFAAD
jgi:hypothetical protein